MLNSRHPNSGLVMARSNIAGTRSDAAATAPRRSAGVVLLVEDEPSVRNVTKKMLEIRGYTVLVSESPEEAIRVLASYTGSVDVLLTDVKLPGMDGVELAAQLRRSRPGLKVVFTSGYARDEAFPDPRHRIAVDLDRRGDSAVRPAGTALRRRGVAEDARGDQFLGGRLPDGDPFLKFPTLIRSQRNLVLRHGFLPRVGPRCTGYFCSFFVPGPKRSQA